MTEPQLDGLSAQERDRLLKQTETIITKDSLSREIALRRIRDALRKSNAALAAGRRS